MSLSGDGMKEVRGGGEWERGRQERTEEKEGGEAAWGEIRRGDKLGKEEVRHGV